MASTLVRVQPLPTTSNSPKLDSSFARGVVNFVPPHHRNCIRRPSISCKLHGNKDFAVPRRNVMALILAGCILSRANMHNIAYAQPVGFREYIDTFDGYSLKYPQNWIQVRGAGADIFFRDPYVLDENLSVDISSPSSSKYKSVEDLGSPEEAGKKVLRQYLTEFMSTRLGVRRESSILSTSSRVANDGRLYYEVEVNIKSYANNNELAVMPQERVARLEWDRRYLSVLGVENNRLYELRIQTPEKVFVEEESDIREVMDSFRVNKPAGENYANPQICFFHVVFKAAALAFYMLSAFFVDSFVISFVVTVLLSALDFWVVKNVSGRILVGLRWWNEINEDGESVWKFECLDQESLARMNKKDSWLFWWTLYLTAVVWIFFGIFSLIRFQADYVLVVGVCLILSIANIVGFTKCQKDARKQLQAFATQNLTSRLSSTIQSAFSVV